MRWAPASWSVCPASAPKVWWTTSCWCGTCAWPCAGPGPSCPRPTRPWGGSRAAPRSCACGSWPCCVWPCPGPTCPPPRRWPACAPKTVSGRALPRAATCSCLPSPRRRAGLPTASTTTRLWWTWTPCGAPLRAPGWSMRCRKLRQGSARCFDGGGRGVFW